MDCARCGDFQISRMTADELGLPFKDPKQQALASHIIRKLQGTGTRPVLDRPFFESLAKRTLPTPAETIDNLLVWFAQQADGSPGKIIKLVHDDPKLMGITGVADSDDIKWIVDSLRSGRLFEGVEGAGWDEGALTRQGWQRFEELKRAHISSRFAFFARRFANSDLDAVFERCLRPAVAETGYELRTAVQRAGLIDAVIEDEIRRCRFLIADLSDDNGGAYWEAGFAEGLGKPVIYVCRAEHETHFDTNHRHTVRWDLASLNQTAAMLKAVIRNTLLGDATQTD